MKTLIAASLAILLLFTAGFFATTTVTEKIGQTCSSESTYRNSWRDVYFVGSWLPKRDDSKSFLQCVGPSEYLRYHPVDLAFVSLVGAVGAGLIAYRSETMDSKKLKQKARS